MGALVQINNVTLSYMEWKSQPVVTRQQVADVHGISLEAVRDAHNRNTKHFKKGTDYFRLTGEQVRGLAHLALSQQAQILIVYSERGYLKLAKTFTDDTAWAVQDLLIDSYFRLRVLSGMDQDVAYLKRRILLADPTKWERRFPNEVRDHICRLWGCKPGRWLRQIYKEVFYERVYEDWARAEIRKMNPRKNGDLARKDHQHINHSDIGGMQFQAHMATLLEVLPKCQARQQLVFILDVVAPKRSDRQGKLLFLPGVAEQRQVG